MPDFLPVSMQDFLHRRESALQTGTGKIIAEHGMKRAGK
jgi:hypothetical protein